MGKKENWTQWKSYIVFTNNYGNQKCAIATKKDVESIGQLPNTLLNIAQKICDVNGYSYTFAKVLLSTNIVVLDFDDLQGVYC